MAIDPLFSQYVWLARKEVVKACKAHAGVDGFNKDMCRHSGNTSYGILEGTQGLTRCSILACPHKDATYDLAKKLQMQETNKEGLDLFAPRPPHLKVVSSS
jgi:hypothetical protein